MAVHLFEHKLSYFSVPKIACTSLKHFFFEVENGFEFREYKASGREMHIHNAAYPCRPIAKEPRKLVRDHWKVAVVREPIGRLLSCYSHRVLYHNELDAVQLTPEDVERGMTTRPDLSTFIAHLERYSELSPSIEHHAAPMVRFLGSDAEYFDRIYRIDETGQLMEDVAERVGSSPKAQRLSRGGGLKASQLTDEEQERLRTYYAEDFRVFGDIIDRVGEPVAG